MVDSIIGKMLKESVVRKNCSKELKQYTFLLHFLHRLHFNGGVGGLPPPWLCLCVGLLVLWKFLQNLLAKYR